MKSHIMHQSSLRTPVIVVPVLKEGPAVGHLDTLVIIEPKVAVVNVTKILLEGHIGLWNCNWTQVVRGRGLAHLVAIVVHVVLGRVQFRIEIGHHLMAFLRLVNKLSGTAAVSLGLLGQGLELGVLDMVVMRHDGTVQQLGIDDVVTLIVEELLDDQVLITITQPVHVVRLEDVVVREVIEPPHDLVLQLGIAPLQLLLLLLQESPVLLDGLPGSCRVQPVVFRREVDPLLIVVLLLTHNLGPHQLFVREDQDQEGQTQADQVGQQGVPEALVGQEPGPCEVAQGEGHCPEEDQLVELGGDHIWPGDRALATAVEGVLLDPVHAEVGHDGEEDDDGLQGDEEAGEDEVVDEVDVLQADLELHLLTDLVQLELVEVEPPF